MTVIDQPSPTTIWPSTRSAHASEAVFLPSISTSSILIIFGGMNEDTDFNDLYLLDTSTMIWHKVVTESTPVARYGHTLTKLSETKVLLAGGMTYDEAMYLGDIWILDLIVPTQHGTNSFFDTEALVENSVHFLRKRLGRFLKKTN